MCPSEISGKLTLLPPSLSFYNLETKTQTVQTQRNLIPSPRRFYRPENPCRQGTAAEKDLAW